MRDKIIKSAEERFFKDGYRKVTMDEIASDLGISKKTLYKYFSGKESIATAVIEKIHSHIVSFLVLFSVIFMPTVAAAGSGLPFQVRIQADKVTASGDTIIANISAFSSEPLTNATLSLKQTLDTTRQDIHMLSGKISEETLVDLNQVLTEIQALVDQGAKEVTLLGQNVNSYIYEDIGFPGLLRRVLNETDLPRLRFMTSHPKDLRI